MRQLVDLRNASRSCSNAMISCENALSSARAASSWDARRSVSTASELLCAGEHAQALAVEEREMRVGDCDFRPERPQASVVAQVRRVDEHDAARRELRQPVGECLCDVLPMRVVDVQQVDAGIGDESQSLGRGRVQQRRDEGVVPAEKARQVDGLGVRFGAAGWRRERQRPGVHPASQHRLAEGGERHPAACAEFDDAGRAAGADEPMPERDVGQPGAVHAAPGRLPEQRVQQFGRQRG